MVETPVRILHVLKGMNRGGIETWLMHLVRNMDRRRFQIDFAVHTTKECAYDSELRTMGCRIHRCLYPRRLWRFGPQFRRLLREYGPYDVVHSHSYFYSGYVLRLAAREQVPMRIAHAHNDRSVLDNTRHPIARLKNSILKRWIQQYSTLRLAISRNAANAVFGRDWDEDPGAMLVFYAIDTRPYSTPPNAAAIRRSFGIPEDAFVVGHVGRFCEQKNHFFLLEIAREVVNRLSSARVILVGDGPLREKITRRIHELNLQNNVIMAGIRADVHAVLHTMDVFVFPSLWEGFGLVALEAQAAGVPVVLSRSVPPEVGIIDGLCHWHDLHCSTAVWATTILACGGKRMSSSLTVPTIDQSGFELRNMVKKMEQVYAPN